MIKAVKRKISGIPIPKIPNAVEEIEVNARFFILDDFDMFFSFQKAFTLVFDKGVGIIQKTYNADKIKD